MTPDEAARSRKAGGGPDNLDRLIDGALEAMSGEARIDVRARVLSRLDDAGAPPPALWVVLRRPATIAVAAVALIVAVAVTVTWRQADPGAGQAEGRSDAVDQARLSQPAPVAQVPDVSSEDVAANASGEREASVASGARDAGGASAEGHAPPPVRTARRAAGASPTSPPWPAEPSDGGFESPASAEHAGARLPGAPAGEPGEPIPLMPAPQPIVIPAIAPAPIVVPPSVVDLGTPVGLLPIIDPARGGPDPGKSGGIRP